MDSSYPTKRRRASTIRRPAHARVAVVVPGSVDIRADDVPDGINAADHAAGLSSSLDNLAASVGC